MLNICMQDEKRPSFLLVPESQKGKGLVRNDLCALSLPPPRGRVGVGGPKGTGGEVL